MIPVEVSTKKEIQNSITQEKKASKLPAPIVDVVVTSKYNKFMALYSLLNSSAVNTHHISLRS
jgi:hypothetical protein